MTPEEKKKGGSRLEHKNESPKKGKKARSRDEIIRRRVTILAVVAAVMLTMALGLKMWIREPEITPPPTPSQGAYEPGKEPVQVSGRKEGVYTFLLLGRDTGGGGNTDTMMVASYDTKNQTVNVLNIYRDTMVNAPWDIKRINSVYNFNGGGEEGIEALKGYLMDLLGFAPDYYITIEWEAVGELVDAVGGVTFDVPLDMSYDDPTQDLHIHVDKGEQKLDGDKAMQLLRWRKNNKLVNGHVVNYDAEGGDVRRIQIQQDFLKATLQQCLEKVRDLPTILRLGRIFLENVETDLPLNSVAYLAQSAVLGGLSMEDVTFLTMPYQGGMVWSRSLRGMQDYVTPRADELLKLVNQYLNPYNADLTRDSLDVMSIQADGTIASSTGRLADTKHNALWLEYQAAQNAPPEETDPPAPEETPPEETPPEESGGPETPETPLPGDTSPTVTLPVEPAPTEAPAVQTLPVESRPLPDGIPIA